MIIPKVKESDITGMVPTKYIYYITTQGLFSYNCNVSKKFSKEKFKIFHPGGNIGNSLLLAKDIMVTGSKMPVANYKDNLSKAIKVVNKKLGIVVIMKNKFIVGIITDGDLRRELNHIRDKEKLENL